MGLGFTASTEGDGAFGPPPGLPLPARHARLPRRVRLAIQVVLLAAVPFAVVLLFVLTPR
jgi:hypothetical protein